MACRVLKVCSVENSRRCFSTRINWHSEVNLFWSRFQFKKYTKVRLKFLCNFFTTYEQHMSSTKTLPKSTQTANKNKDTQMYTLFLILCPLVNGIIIISLWTLTLFWGMSIVTSNSYTHHPLGHTTLPQRAERVRNIKKIVKSE